jgi:NAD(P) transhydrogenase subunit alpha
VLALIAVVLSSMNLVGGFAVTDRMLRMFTTVRRPRSELPPVPGRGEGDR